MIVAPFFDGDEAMSVAWAQHDVYGQALGIIRQGCAEHTMTAAGILGLEPPTWTRSEDGIDHRTLQHAHDLLAAAWRFRVDVAQTRLALERQPADPAAEWLQWLQTEVRSWRERPDLIRLVGAVVAEQNTAAGYAAEDRLTLALMERFADVPWSVTRLALKAELETSSAEDLLSAKSEPLRRVTKAAHDTGCICATRRRPPCTQIPCKTLCEIAERGGGGPLE